MFTKILVASDGSSHARAALGQAADIARAEQASLTVLTSYSTVLAWPGVGFGALSQDIFDELMASARAEAQKLVDEAVATLPEGMTVTTRLIDGPAAEAILTEAREGGYDLIAVGSRGRGDIGSMFLGSVSHRVLHSCHLPVLVVTARARRDQRADRPAAAATQSARPSVPAVGRV
jgi:nucleotide-binding universal stress UspA family protein